MFSDPCLNLKCIVSSTVVTINIHSLCNNGHPIVQSIFWKIIFCHIIEYIPRFDSLIMH